jgi:hypothetical protein
VSKSAHSTGFTNRRFRRLEGANPAPSNCDAIHPRSLLQRRGVTAKEFVQELCKGEAGVDVGLAGVWPVLAPSVKLGGYGKMGEVRLEKRPGETASHLNCTAGPAIPLTPAYAQMSRVVR